MATIGITRICGPRSSIPKRYNVDLCNVLKNSPRTRVSLANKFYQARLIDLPMKKLTTRSEEAKDADSLLEHLSLKVEQSSDFLPGIINIIGSETRLENIAKEMNLAVLNAGEVTFTATGEKKTDINYTL